MKIISSLIEFEKYLIGKNVLTRANLIPTFVCFLLSIVLTCVLVYQVVGHISYAVQVSNEIKNNTMTKAEIDSNNQKIANGNYDNKDAYVEKKLIGLLSPKEISSLTQVYWNYDLRINEKCWGHSSTRQEYCTEVCPHDVKITITQKEGIRILPVNIHVMGMVTAGDKNDNFYDHILFDENVKYSRDISKEDGVTTVVYTIKDMKAGQSFGITLSEPLAKRLNLTSRDITITTK